jgi:hypothetical protein
LNPKNLNIHSPLHLKITKYPEGKVTKNGKLKGDRGKSKSNLGKDLGLNLKKLHRRRNPEGLQGQNQLLRKEIRAVV